MTWEMRNDIEQVWIRLDTVVSTLQILIEAKDQRDPDLAAALALLRDTVAEQSKRLEEINEALQKKIQEVSGERGLRTVQ